MNVLLILHLLQKHSLRNVCQERISFTNLIFILSSEGPGVKKERNIIIGANWCIDFHVIKKIKLDLLRQNDKHFVSKNNLALRHLGFVLNVAL